MKKRVELPLLEPIYSTYHNGAFSAAIYENPTIRNHYLNSVMQLTCNRLFLSGYTTPKVNIVGCGLVDIPYFEQIQYSMQFLDGHVNYLIRNLIDNGYYVYFAGVDDYYVEGKSWYKERHFAHDGTICGYDQNEKTYCIYAYDSNWIYQKFWTPQKSFDKGRNAMLKKNNPCRIFAYKPLKTEVNFRPEIVLKNISEYLDSSMRKYPKSGQGDVFGIAVHNYLAMYVDKLYDGSIPYEKMDRRVLRIIWEHKKVMLERLEKMESVLGLNSRSSSAYKKIVSKANNIRLLYASYHIKQRNSLLPTIHDGLITIKNHEYKLLKRFVKKAEKKLSKEI